MIKRAANEHIFLDRDFRVKNSDGTGISSAPSNGGASGGNASGEGERAGIDPGQPPAGIERDRKPNILDKPCFRDLVDASISATKLFRRIEAKIRKAFDGIEPMPQGRSKVKPGEEDQQKFFLTERDIDHMEKQIDAHRLEVHIALIAFDATMLVYAMCMHIL